jgi:hypothetical protein
MIASRMGLWIAGAFAVGLALIVIFDVRRDHAPRSRELVPGLAVDNVHELAWPERGIVLRRDAKGAWAWAEPAALAGPADPRTVGDLLAALRAARWHRRVDNGHIGGPAHDALVIDGGTRLALTAPVEHGGLVWLVRDGASYLIDAWVARALSPEPLALRVHVPFPDPSSARELRLDGVTLRGTPRTLVEPVQLVIADPLVDALEHALGQLAVVALPRAPVVARSPTVQLDAVAVSAGEGGCGTGQVAITGTFGPGCVDDKAWQAIAAAGEALRGKPAEIADPRPVPFEPTQLVLPDATVLEVKKRLRIGDRDADPARVTELLAVLAAPAEIVALPAARPTGELVANAADGGAHVLDLYGNGIVARRGEPVALRIGAGGYALLVRPSEALRDPTVWLEEPTTVASITIDGTTFTRGAVIGEWTRSGPGPDNPGMVDRLVEQLSILRGHGAAPAGGTKRHEVTLHIVPPTRADVHTRTLTISATRDACIGNGEFLLYHEVCSLADRLVAQ